MDKQLKKKEESVHLDANYKDFLSGIKDRLKAAQIRAALAANSELIKFYWGLRADLVEKKAFKWGRAFFRAVFA